MQKLSADVDAPPLPFTIRSGRRPLQQLGRRLRSYGWILVAIPAGYGLLGLVDGGPRAAAVETGLWILLLWGAMAVAVLCLWLYGRSTITVTGTELIVKRVRRRVLAREELGGMVLGWFTVRPGREGDVQLCFARRGGKAFARTPRDYWSLEDLARVAAALGTVPRTEGTLDRKLAPFYFRHLFLTAFVGVAVMLALIVGVIVGYDAVQQGRLDSAAQQAQREWDDHVARHLTEEHLTGLYLAEGEVDPVEDESGLRLRTDLAFTMTAAEVDPDLVAAAREAVCGFRPELDRPLESSVDMAFTPPDALSRDGEATRYVDLSCHNDPELLTDWLEVLRRQPPPAVVSRVDSANHVYGEPGLEIELSLAAGGKARLRRRDAPRLRFDGRDRVQREHLAVHAGTGELLRQRRDLRRPCPRPGGMARAVPLIA